jgi:hypothetical protein
MSKRDSKESSTPETRLLRRYKQFFAHNIENLEKEITSFIESKRDVIDKVIDEAYGAVKRSEAKLGPGQQIDIDRLSGDLAGEFMVWMYDKNPDSQKFSQMFGDMVLKGLMRDDSSIYMPDEDELTEWQRSTYKIIERIIRSFRPHLKNLLRDPGVLDDPNNGSGPNLRLVKD